MSPRRILVIANETAESLVLRDAIQANLVRGRSAEVVVVAPMLNSRLRHWLSDEKAARAAAEWRLDRCIVSLAAVGIEGVGCLGDADPLQAIADALRRFRPDVIVVSTHPEHRSNWLSRGIVGRAERRFGLPVVHVVVEAGHDFIAGAAPAIARRVAA